MNEHKSLSVSRFGALLCLLSAVLVAPLAQAGEIITRPWLQNVYTNRFAVMCETRGEMEDLAVQYGDDFSGVATMMSTNGLKEGTFVYKAQIGVLGDHPLPAGATIPYRLATNGVAIAGTEGSVKLWEDGDKAFTCAIWGDNQEGVHEYDWGGTNTTERYRCVREMFKHMSAQKPDFGFTTGDISSFADYDNEIEPGDLRAADDLFCKGETPYHLIWGNHDCVGTFFGEVYTNAAQRYFSPAASEEDGWFYLYRNDVLFIGVHWTWGQEGQEERYERILKEVAALLETPRAKQAKFRILMQHAPVFLELYNVLPGIEWFDDSRTHDVAVQGGVDLIFSGHTHAYERIERDGLIQITNGGMGYLDHGERCYKNFGTDTKVGGHQNTPYLWARQNGDGALGDRPLPASDLHLAPAQPVRMGCFTGYGILKVEGDTLTYKAHAFDANGDYIGVADSFELKSSRARVLKSSSAQVQKVTPFTPTALTSPVNNATWKEFKTAQGEAWDWPAAETGDDPVVNVSKTEIVRFCAALNSTTQKPRNSETSQTNYRLPTVEELTEIFGGNLKRDVSEWTSDVDPNTGWCRILGGNRKAVDGTWCRAYDKPAIATADCHANYLGFRVIDAADPIPGETVMDRALAALEKIENPAEVYQWSALKGKLVDISDEWTKPTTLDKRTYGAPVIFTGKGPLVYRVRREVSFDGGLAAPNATALNIAHVLDLGPVSKPVTIKGEFRGGVSTNEWTFAVRCDELTFDTVLYRGQALNVVTDSRELHLEGTNDFSGAVMTVCCDRKLLDPFKDCVTNLVTETKATLKLRALHFSNRGVVEEVLVDRPAGLTVGENVTLVTAENVLFGIDGSTLRVNGALDAAGIDIEGHLMGLLPQEATLAGSGEVATTHFGMCDVSTLYVDVANTTVRSSVPYRTYTSCTNGCNVVFRAQRKPDYADATGRDWLFNHDIPAKRYAGEPAADPGVDLFFLYPTSVYISDERCVDGICDIDNPVLRGPNGATNAWEVSAEVFGDFTHVYAPYYRQTPSDVEVGIGAKPNANANMREYWYERAPYEDVTNALTHYFTVINPDGKRPFIFAGHSHGSGMLSLVMEHFFAEDPARKAWLRNMVACYAIGWGVSKDWEAKLNDNLGLYVATNATDAGVYVFWNTYGPNTNATECILYPEPGKSAASVNPLLWTRVATNATAELNLGGWTTDDPPRVLPHLYDASNHVANGTLICTSKDVESQYLPPLHMFGEHSLHGWDYKLYWENIRDNAYARIKTATGSKPCCGTPTDYSASENWLSRPATADKGLDVFYLYPTCVPLDCPTLVSEIDDGMKANAQEEYERGPSTFESYANVYAPYYRQGSVLMIVADTSTAGTERFCSTHVVKTDVFAALDYYFTNLNVNAARPFILASHSQGSANMKNVLAEYFVGEKAAYIQNLVAAYILGWKITPDWCETIGLPFATGADDTRVVMTWNAEGPGETGDNFLTDDPTQLAINPINWSRDTLDAPKADNLGSVITNAQGVLYHTGKPGVTGARLQTNRPGAVIMDAPETIPVDFTPGFGTKSYHFEDWGFFHDNVGNNGFTRYAAFAGLAEVKTNDVPKVADATWKVLADGREAVVSPVDGKYYAPTDAQEVKLVYTLDPEKAAEGYRFVNGETTTSFAMKLEGGAWATTATKAEIEAATTTGLPTLKLGVVAQRYPWDGKVDAHYKATYWPAGQKGLIEITVGETSVTSEFEAVVGEGVLVIDMREHFGETAGKAIFRLRTE